MELPKTIINILRRNGLDIDYIIDVLTVNLNIDPPSAAKAHAKLALAMFNEGLSFVDKGDVVQASERLYKAVEGSVKALAIARGLDEAREALSKGRWTVSLLDKAARRLGDKVWRAWTEAYFLHVNGFHEVRIDVDDVRARIPIIQELINEVKKSLGVT
ncbi:PaREP1 family protein [Vulcanisaeta distributa]|uniref:PaREP1 family protein n=1 Tax=Vulcanisaeta distributa (strain DSM 14429 / JCM 11212 / NBRC 100878 / IC-017) TaxID=572478 RepID=E1QSH5_VULDI|nr:PaREP1 family protein [Vulcanisaeta distributa]ADN50768.1 PaREP1 family protein [Vulcanisaeta distributa DSM 14429]